MPLVFLALLRADCSTVDLVFGVFDLAGVAGVFVFSGDFFLALFAVSGVFGALLIDFVILFSIKEEDAGRVGVLSLPRDFGTVLVRREDPGETCNSSADLWHFLALTECLGRF